MPRLTPIAPALALAMVLIAGCDRSPDTRTTPAESAVTARAVTDVDAAMADTLRAPAVPAPGPVATEDEASGGIRP